VGLLMSAWVQLWAARGLYDRERHLSVENFAMYWQFVDAVWAFVLLAVYISPRL
jgi:cytochrome c oxidase subunit III